MTSDQPENETIGHLERGKDAVREIEANGLAIGAQPICHHFSSDADDSEQSYEHQFGSLIADFEVFGLELLPDRLEAWEQVIVSDAWLERRIPQMLELGRNYDFYYAGWSCEPRDHKLISATTFGMIDNRTVQ